MRLHYYPETDSLYIELRDEPAATSHEIVDGFLADLTDSGWVVGLDIDCSVHRVDVSEINAIGLPLRK